MMSNLKIIDTLDSYTYGNMIGIIWTKMMSNSICTPTQPDIADKANHTQSWKEIFIYFYNIASYPWNINYIIRQKLSFAIPKPKKDSSPKIDLTPLLIQRNTKRYEEI